VLFWDERVVKACCFLKDDDSLGAYDNVKRTRTKFVCLWSVIFLAVVFISVSRPSGCTHASTY